MNGEARSQIIVNKAMVVPRRTLWTTSGLVIVPKENFSDTMAILPIALTRHASQAGKVLFSAHKHLVPNW